MVFTGGSNSSSGSRCLRPAPSYHGEAAPRQVAARPQVQTESFDKVGKEYLRQLSTQSQDGIRAGAKDRGFRREKDSTGSGSRRWQRRQGKKEEEGEGKKWVAKETAVFLQDRPKPF